MVATISCLEQSLRIKYLDPSCLNFKKFRDSLHYLVVVIRSVEQELWFFREYEVFIIFEVILWVFYLKKDLINFCRLVFWDDLESIESLFLGQISLHLKQNEGGSWIFRKILVGNIFFQNIIHVIDIFVFDEPVKSLFDRAPCILNLEFVEYLGDNR